MKKEFVMLALTGLCLTVTKVHAATMDYGVLIGEDDLSQIGSYSLVVIEPETFAQEDIVALHERCEKVYGYLNIGALEEYRSYYEEYEELCLSVYEEWPDEQWIDVSAEEWQAFITDLGKEYISKGIDGLFLDNTDVYYQYPEEKIYQGLCEILTKLDGIPLIVNGGDPFVQRCIDEGQNLFDGINQENVFTKGVGQLQEPEDQEYYRNYLQKAADSGLEVYLTEYGADDSLTEEIDEYCKKHGFHWFNAENLELLIR
ncbi:MAG: endo alpha-1,4 polygalactosaminidase [Eubacteriales bacterium]|nr:endo alpha-1,4 polygalactosaminidase [Eubacteriales bacterium]